MNLITSIINEDKQHHNYKSLLKDDLPTLRKIQEWADGFHDRDNKFVREFQQTFNSSFWEIYLYKLFKTLNFNIKWDKPSPDFDLSSQGLDFIVEAATSNHAVNSQPEWERDISNDKYEYYISNMNKINEFSIIRHANTLFSKHKRYTEYYSTLEHVRKKPFIVALGSYEIPFFYHQYDRAIIALLYNHYINEEVFTKEPNKYPSGPPSEKLDFVQKENGSEIEVGIFLNDRMREISAVIFNPLATTSKINCKADRIDGAHTHVWYHNDNTISQTLKTEELIEDGVFIFHNPFAKYPLPIEVFKNKRIRQVNYDIETGELLHYFEDKHLAQRVNFNISYKK
ncbi:hypothetical protein L5E75_01270 [Aliarcobacter butzleri]|uniref:hypothetical protein n=1 Tax=Aliarcobacter butzleri TaxID=28197 RepID=UPI000657D280|nr:hypothetical protein [Aliarcobacter butzleri]KLE06638.1 hypothetical protein AF78_02540 [Aliarcobacter butzleri L353]MCG3712128.1 hypothetical protein [Aliarcobacter butzleri]